MKEKYSVLMSMYCKDNPTWLKEAIDSMLKQTIKPAEFVIVKDGPIGDELDSVITSYEQAYSGLFKVVPLPENAGLGLALKRGVECCTYDLIARMDSDDISAPNRIEKQLAKLESSPEVDVIGCLVDEFIDSADNVTAHVILPETHKEIANFAIKRCPIRHSSLLFRKEAVIQAGNYRDFLYTEDYELVARMLHIGKNFYNIQEVLLYMRVSKDFYKRRGGVHYLKSVYILKKALLSMGFFSKKDFLVSFVPHAIVILMPGFVRTLIYNRLLRG